MPNSGTATINFGTNPGVNETSIAVTAQAGILSNSQVEAFFMADDSTTDHSAADHKYAPCLMSVTCGNIIVGTGFTIYARSPHYLTGQWIVHWVWA